MSDTQWDWTQSDNQILQDKLVNHAKQLDASVLSNGEWASLIDH